MPAAGSWAEDFDPRPFEVVSCLRELLGQVRSAIGVMSAVRGRGMRDWPRDPGFAGTRGSRQRGGGFGGPSGGWWPGAPGSAGSSRGRTAGRGDVRAAILAVLSDGPRNGYQIMSEIEERSGGAWRPSPGAVYPALSLLADEGLIAGEESGGGRTFTLTDSGRAYVAQNPEMARGPWESTARQEAWQVPALFTVAARLGSGIVQMGHGGTPGQIHAAEQLLEQTRRRLYQILADDFSGEHGEQ